MVMDPAAIRALGGGQSTSGTPVDRSSAIGARFQLALLAAAQGNDQEAGDYLREIITAMKSMVRPGGADAEGSPNP